jgi:hypothetical protein
MFVRPGHKGMPTVASGQTLDFPRRQALASRNVRVVVTV